MSWDPSIFIHDLLQRTPWKERFWHCTRDWRARPPRAFNQGVVYKHILGRSGTPSFFLRIRYLGHYERMQTHKIHEKGVSLHILSSLIVFILLPRQPFTQWLKIYILADFNNFGYFQNHHLVTLSDLKVCENMSF